MARVKARVQVHLPYDVNGTTASPGQIIEVETDHPQIIGYLEGGLLVALDPLEFPGDLQPPPVSDEDAAATVAANQDDEEDPEAGEPGSTQGRDGAPLKDAGEPIAPDELEEQAAAERAAAGTETDASADPDAAATDRESDAEPRETPSTRPSRAKK